MTGPVQHLLGFAAAHPSIVGLLVLLSAAAEAFIVVGALFPGTSIVLALAGLAGAAHGNVWLLILWAIAGAVIGDGVSFWIGHRYGDRLRSVWPFAGRPDLLDRGARFFARHGGKGVFFARFLPGVRAVVPVAAGMLGMTVTRFYTANVASAAVWAVSHVLPAAGAGVAFATLGNVSGRLAVLLAVALGSVLVAVWTAHFVVRWLAPVASAGYERVIERLGRRPGLLSRRVARVLDPAQPRLAAVALWSGVLIIAVLGFTGLLEDLVTGDPLVRADVAINHLVQSLRTPIGDTAMVVLTSLGDSVVTGGVVLAVVGWLLFRRAPTTAGAVVVALGASSAFVLLMKQLLHKPRPIELYSGADAFSFPSGHTALATVLYGVLAVLISKSLPRPAQVVIFAFAGALAGAIGLSRIYLSAHWPSDVLGGLFFGVGMTAVFALVLDHLPARRIGRLGLAAATTTTFLALGTWHASSSLHENLSRYARQPTVIATDLWNWTTEAWRGLPTNRIDLVGESEEPFILQWAGDTRPLLDALAKSGWRSAPAWSAKDIGQVLSPAATVSSLPPLPVFHDGRRAVLTLTRAIPNAAGQRLVFRAWRSHMEVVDGQTRAPILLGSLTLEAVVHPLGLVTTLRNLDPPESAASEVESDLRAARGVRTLAHPGGRQISGGKAILAMPSRWPAGADIGPKAEQGAPRIPFPS